MKFTIALALMAAVATVSDAACWKPLSDQTLFTIADGVSFPQDFSLKSITEQDLCNESTTVDVFVKDPTISFSGMICLRDPRAQVEKCGKQSQCCAPAFIDPEGSGAAPQDPASLSQRMYAASFKAPDGEVGVCNRPIDFSTDVPMVALPETEFTTDSCNQCVRITGANGSIVAPISSMSSPEVPAGMIQLSAAAAVNIATPDEFGMASVSYEVVNCQ